MFLINRCRVAPTLVFAAVAMLSLGQSSFAQTGAPVPLASPAIMQTNDPKNPMHYTPDQQRATIALRTDMQKQAAKIIEDNSLSQNDKQQKIAGLRAEALAKFTALLTPAQKAKNSQLQAAVQSVNTKYLALNKQLIGTLTADQKSRIEAAKSGAVAKQQSITSGPGSDDDKRAQIMQLQQSYESQVNTIFTPSQLALIKQMTALRESIPAVEHRVLAGN